MCISFVVGTQCPNLKFKMTFTRGGFLEDSDATELEILSVFRDSVVVDLMSFEAGGSTCVSKVVETSISKIIELLSKDDTVLNGTPTTDDPIHNQTSRLFAYRYNPSPPTDDLIHKRVLCDTANNEHIHNGEIVGFEVSYACPKGGYTLFKVLDKGEESKKKIEKFRMHSSITRSSRPSARLANSSAVGKRPKKKSGFYAEAADEMRLAVGIKSRLRNYTLCGN